MNLRVSRLNPFCNFTVANSISIYLQLKFQPRVTILMCIFDRWLENIYLNLRGMYTCSDRTRERVNTWKSTDPSRQVNYPIASIDR